MKNLLSILTIVLLISMSSCAKLQNKIDSDGQLIGSKAGSWIVIKQSGGIITDVWLLRNKMVQSEENSDGWLFKDENDNPVHVGGDMKAIRVNNNEEKLFSLYIEYHMEFDSLRYHERLRLSKR